MKINKKNCFAVIVVAIFMAAVIAGGSFYYFLQKKVPEKEIVKNEQVQIIATSTDWKTYKNEKYGFGLEYPTNWYVDESDSEYEITFSDINENYIDKNFITVYPLGRRAGGFSGISTTSDINFPVNVIGSSDYLSQSGRRYLTFATLASGVGIEAGVKDVEAREIVKKIISSFKYINYQK